MYQDLSIVNVELATQEMGSIALVGIISFINSVSPSFFMLSMVCWIYSYLVEGTVCNLEQYTRCDIEKWGIFSSRHIDVILGIL